MRKNKGLFAGIIAALIAFSSSIIIIGALVAMEIAKSTSDVIGDLFTIDSNIKEHLITDLLFLGITGVAYVFSLRKIKNDIFSFIILLVFMASIFVFGSDVLLQFEAMKVEKLDGQFGFYIFEKVAYTSLIYPVVGLIYDRYRRKLK
ncbi:hypothetical protein REB14_18030 [Chryseobacterium sp. ES2]|uniref:DUF4386 domain-containing protein n=1 Tax=Chryseobacterium metallicongregator TaxID=3073042 RepID=A0ABU1E8D7_9FLAO|nr:hypothetical protein [Chryseobacterium sp. ES2]MDR4954080.1 hypothetical protein [Chryseobacterium sp. ES2]